MPKISPFLWFEDRAEEAVNFYISVFKNSHIVSVTNYPESSPFLPGAVMLVDFVLDGMAAQALNAGPGHPFTDAISLFIKADTQPEIDEFWEKLTADGGEPGPCGWLKDKFGLWWQVAPSNLDELYGGPEPEKSARAMQAMMTMSKLDIAALWAAYNGE